MPGIVRYTCLESLKTQSIAYMREFTLKMKLISYLMQRWCLPTVCFLC